MNDNNARQNIVDNIKKVDTILVTVSTNPSVDELSAALALTMFINDIDKHATAVVSGNLPPAIHFLEPEKTFEDTVDSLRDFVIALDKEKADHLRYKVDGDVVKIFITPYKTVITSKDLEYSQGDYNVEMVIALGVKDKDRLDKALAAHGRILHDAIVATIGLEPSELGTVDYSDGSASSMAELVARVVFALSDDKATMSEQVASALLTGIVAATDRFSNDHTTSEVMSTAAKLMSAGANQQLIASKLREGSKTPMVDDQVSEKIEKGQPEKKNRKRRKNRGLSIEHDTDESTPETAGDSQPDAVPNLETMLEQASAEQGPGSTESEGNVSPEEEALSEQQTDAQESAPDEQVPSETVAPLSAEALLDDALGAKEAASTNPPAADLATELEQAASAEAAPQDQAQTDIAQGVEDATVNELSSAQTAASSEDKPRFGGVLNATTEQAAEDKRRSEAADRNRTILSHDRPSQGYVEQSLSSSPLNGAGDDQKEEMFNPLAEPVVGPELPPVSNVGAATMPPAAAPVEPTLADIDLQNREVPRAEPTPSVPEESAAEAPVFTPVPAPEEVTPEGPQQAASSALEAVQAAYEAAPVQTPAPIVTPAMEAIRANEAPQDDVPMMPMADLSAGIPTPPPPPPPEFGANGFPEAPQGAPVPDFSQLPTPPTVPDVTPPEAAPMPTLPPENLETILPPPQNVAPPAGPSDPGEFRIPGQ